MILALLLASPFKNDYPARPLEIAAVLAVVTLMLMKPYINWKSRSPNLGLLNPKAWEAKILEYVRSDSKPDT